MRQTTGLKKAWAAFLLRQNLIWVFVLDTNSLKLYLAFKILDQYDEKVILSNFDKNISPNVYLTEDLVWVNPPWSSLTVSETMNKGEPIYGVSFCELYLPFCYKYLSVFEVQSLFNLCRICRKWNFDFFFFPDICYCCALPLHFGVILNEVSLFSIEIAFPTSTFLSMAHLVSILLLYYYQWPI